MNEINCWRLIKEKSVDEIRLLGKKKNNYIVTWYAIRERE